MSSKCSVDETEKVTSSVTWVMPSKCSVGENLRLYNDFQMYCRSK